AARRLDLRVGDPALRREVVTAKRTDTSHAMERTRRPALLGGPDPRGDRRPLDPAGPARLLPESPALRGFPDPPRDRPPDPRRPAPEAGGSLRAQEGRLPGAPDPIRIPPHRQGP